jgi:hypothetical protein
MQAACNAPDELAIGIVGRVVDQKRFRLIAFGSTPGNRFWFLIWFSFLAKRKQ